MILRREKSDVRKYISIILCVILCFLTCAESVAADTEEETLLGLLPKLHNSDENGCAIDSDLLSDEWKDYSFADSPVLTVFYMEGWADVADSDLDDRVNKARQNNKLEYYVLGDAVYRMSEKFMKPLPVDTVPTYISDIMNGSTRQIFLGQEAVVENVICFDGLHHGMAVYYRTDVGIFVRYYADAYSAAVEFSFQDFQNYAAGLASFLSSREYEFIGNGYWSFLDYVANPAQFREQYRKRSFVERYPMVIPVVCAVFVLTVGPMTCYWIHHARRKKFEAMVAELQSDNQVDDSP